MLFNMWTAAEPIALLLAGAIPRMVVEPLPLARSMLAEYPTGMR
jgi:hypothetical protein